MESSTAQFLLRQSACVQLPKLCCPLCGSFIDIVERSTHTDALSALATQYLAASMGISVWP